jgi:hypothetical protein
MESQMSALQSLLDIPYIRRVRRNHGLEHATIHLLSRKVPNLRMVGRSDGQGFWLYGEVDTETVEASVREALNRMRGGEHKLALHPNCGTNLVTVGLLGAAATIVALMGSERDEGGKLARFPLIVLGVMAAALFGQPLGMQLQEHVTTLGEPADLQIKDIKRRLRGSMVMHRVDTWSS